MDELPLAPNFWNIRNMTDELGEKLVKKWTEQPQFCYRCHMSDEPWHWPWAVCRYCFELYELQLGSALRR